MSVQLSIEEEVKKLQKHFGGVVQLVKSLKTSVEALEKKMDEKEAEENKEIKEIINAQAIIDESLVANSDAIKRIDKEIESMERNTAGAVKTGDTLGSAIRGRIRKSGSASISTRVIVNTRENVDITIQIRFAKV